MNNDQYDLFERTLQEQAEKWIHTIDGGMAMSYFIKEALYWKKRKGWKVCGAKFIGERVRWLMTKKKVQTDEPYRLNNNHITYMAYYAERKCPELKGFFRHREQQKKKGNMAVVVRIKQKESVA